MTHDVIDGEVDPFGVRHRGCGAGFHTVRKIWQAFNAAIRMMTGYDASDVNRFRVCARRKRFAARRFRRWSDETRELLSQSRREGDCRLPGVLRKTGLPAGCRRPDTELADPAE